METKEIQELDVKGMNCPLPVVKAKKALSGMEKGEVLRVSSTDPGSVGDFPSFCNRNGYELLSQEEKAGVFEFLIKR